LKRTSVSLRLTLWFCAVFLCGFIVFGLVMWADLALSLSQGRDRTFRRRASRALEALVAVPNLSDERAAKYAIFEDATPEGNLIRVLDSSGRTILFPVRQDSPQHFPWPVAATVDGEAFVDVTFENHPFRVFRRSAQLDGRPIQIEVAGQLEDNRQMLARFSSGLLWTAPALLVASALAGYFMSRRVLLPIGRLTAALRSISIGNLSDRLPVRETVDELDRLAATSNEMLARLESAVTRIKRFTADASHELRSPLSYIHTVAEYVLRAPGLDANVRESVEGILEESAEAIQLLESMLLLARADAGQADFRFEPVDLDAVVREVCDKARLQAEARNQQLVVRCGEPARSHVPADRSSLRRLVWTLLDNAIKYTPPLGSITVTLEWSKTHAILTVRDTGIGIPRDLLPRVFERYFRADPSRGEVHGAGLGLAIAKWAADAHHAELRLESRQGQGSTFTLIFPTENDVVFKRSA
jgi:heavy metal sensor kinase